MPSPPVPKRFFVVFFFLGLFALILISRFAFIMVFNNERSGAPVRPQITERGPILDRNGNLLAIQTRMDSVTAWTPDIRDPRESSELLADLLSLNAEDLLKKMTPKKARFIYIKRKISERENQGIRELLKNKKLEGISLEPGYGRVYPQKEIAAPLLGYVGTDNIGLDGLEYVFNDILSPPALNNKENIIYGNHLYLTLDIDIQYIIRKILRQAMETYRTDFIMGFLMDGRNGEILSMVNLPSFDPNHFTRYPASRRQNKAVSFTYEPGSVFKVFTLGLILNENPGLTEEVFDTSNSYNPEIFRKNKITPITDLFNYGKIRPREIILHSSNVGMAFASETISRKKFYQGIREFGFGEKVELPLPGESRGILENYKNWSLRSKPTIAFGQEIGVSAVQILKAATAFTNKGVILRPLIIKKILGPDQEVIKEYSRTPLRAVLSPATAQTILSYMKNTVDSPVGTVRRAKIPGLPLAAKSGTAQMIEVKTGKYYKDKVLSSVLAVFPADAPRYIAYLVFVNPKGKLRYGGRIVAPVMKQIIREIAPFYGLGNSGKHFRVSSKIILPKPEEPLPYRKGITPSLIGYGKRSIFNYLEKNGIPFLFRGEGRAVRQFPPAGSPLPPRTAVRILFSP